MIKLKYKSFFIHQNEITLSRTIIIIIEDEHLKNDLQQQESYNILKISTVKF